MMSVVEVAQMLPADRAHVMGRDRFVVAVVRAIAASSTPRFTVEGRAYLRRIGFGFEIPGAEVLSTIAQAEAIMAGCPLLDALRAEFLDRARESAMLNPPTPSTEEF